MITSYFFRTSYSFHGNQKFFLVTFFINKITPMKKWSLGNLYISLKWRILFLNINVVYRIFCRMEFFIFTKTFLMNKTRTIGQKWLVNELVFYFWAFKRCAKFQFNPTILSSNCVHRHRTDDWHTDRHFRKNRFLWLRGSQNVNSNVIFHIKPILSHVMKMPTLDFFKCNENNTRHNYNSICKIWYCWFINPYNNFLSMKNDCVN